RPLARGHRLQGRRGGGGGAPRVLPRAELEPGDRADRRDGALEGPRGGPARGDHGRLPAGARRGGAARAGLGGEGRPAGRGGAPPARARRRAGVHRGARRGVSRRGDVSGAQRPVARRQVAVSASSAPGEGASATWESATVTPWSRYFTKGFSGSSEA